MVVEAMGMNDTALEREWAENDEGRTHVLPNPHKCSINLLSFHFLIFIEMVIFAYPFSLDNQKFFEKGLFFIFLHLMIFFNS